VSAARVDDEGIVLPDALDAPVDIAFGGNRLWSFNPARDGRSSGRGVLVAWPGPIRIVFFERGGAPATVKVSVIRRVCP
jgi:hypothetical protein